MEAAAEVGQKGADCAQVISSPDPSFAGEFSHVRTWSCCRMVVLDRQIHQSIIIIHVAYLLYPRQSPDAS